MGVVDEVEGVLGVLGDSERGFEGRAIGKREGEFVVSVESACGNDSVEGELGFHMRMPGFGDELFEAGEGGTGDAFVVEEAGGGSPAFAAEAPEVDHIDRGM